MDLSLYWIQLAHTAAIGWVIACAVHVLYCGATCTFSRRLYVSVPSLGIWLIGVYTHNGTSPFTRLARLRGARGPTDDSFLPDMIGEHIVFIATPMAGIALALLAINAYGMMQDHQEPPKIDPAHSDFGT